MNRVNPLHAGILLLVVLAFLIFKLNGAKSDLQEAKAEYSKTLKLATSLSGLKEVYANKKKTKASLKRLLSHSSIRSANVTQNAKKSGVVLSSQSMSKSALNALMGKILNASYDIQSMKIKKLSANKVSLRMEIKW